MEAAEVPKTVGTGKAGAQLLATGSDAAAGRATRTAMLERWLLGLQPLRHRLLVCAVVGAVYLLAGHFALHLTDERDGVAVFWPASGVAAGAIVALGPRFRWPIVMAVVIATVAVNLYSRSGLALIGVFAACNAIECLLFGWLMRTLDRSRTQLESLGSVVAFLIAAAVGAAVPAVPAALAIEGMTDASAHWTEIWFGWFKSDGLGIVVVAPLLITLPSFVRVMPGPVKLLEAALAVLISVAATYYAFGFPIAGSTPIATPAMLLFPIFVWLAARAPPFFSALAAFLISVVIVGLVLAGEGRFADPAMPFAMRLGSAQSSLLTGGAALLTLSAMFARVSNVAMALQSSEQRLKLTLTAASMYAFDYDLERDIVHRTGGLMPRLGLPEFGSAADYFSALHPDERQAFNEMLNSTSPAGPQLKRLVRMHAADGKELAIEYRSEGEFKGDGRLVRLRGICVDVTDRERSRELVEKQALQLSGALQAGRVFAYDYDNSSKSITRSANSVDILGIPVELLNDPRNLFVEMAHPEDRQALIAYGRREAHDDGFRQQTFRFIRPDGRISWLEVTSTALFDESGKLKAIRGLARDVTEQTRWEQRQTTLIEELDHRVKNGLTRMKVVVTVSRDQHQSLDDYVKVIQGRIDSMARTQERLSRSRWDGVYLEALVADELAAYHTPMNCRIDGPSRLLDPVAAQGFAFTLHELATNAAKHGALSRSGGRVEVVWRIEGEAAGPNELRLIWREIVDGGVVQPKKESYGLRTIRNLLEHEQDARVSLDFTPNGLVCEIAMPLKALAREQGSYESGKNGRAIKGLAPATGAPARQ